MNTSPTFSAAEGGNHHFRFLLPHRHLSSVFGNDWFALKAEAFAAPLILLAQTRQADRDKAHADADAQHREALALAAQERAQATAEQTAQLLELMDQNTKLTELTKQLSQHIEVLTTELHSQVCKSAK